MHSLLTQQILILIFNRKHGSPNSPCTLNSPAKSSPLAVSVQPTAAHTASNGVQTPSEQRTATPSLSSCPSSPRFDTSSESSRDGFIDGEETAAK